MEKGISYLNRNYNDYRNALIEYSKKYYPDMATEFDDASVGSWMIDLNAEIADNLSYHIDRVFQETNINSAYETTSLYSIARNLGVKIPGPKGAMAEVKFTCILPLADGSGQDGNRLPDWTYAPIIRRGTKVSSGAQTFELLYDVNFAEQFSDENGNSDRTIIPVRNSDGLVIKYKVSKLAVVVAGNTKVYSKTISASDIHPFMDVIIPVENVMNIESILVKDGTQLQTYPTYGEFYMPNETSSNPKYTGTTRFFEVDYLAEQYRFGEKVTDQGKRHKYGYLTENGEKVETYSVCRGEWIPVSHKFITEYTDKGYLKIIFGAGMDANSEVDLSGASDFSRYQMTKVLKNNHMGVLPKAGSTMFIMYRVGGGKSSNVAKGAISTISLLNVDIAACVTGASATKISAVRQSIEVINTTPSVSGKDMPTGDELRNFIKYNCAAQNRCVTVKDYISRVLQMPPKFGTPFRVGSSEENNKIVLYTLGIDYAGHLDATLPDALVSNIQDYLSAYRMINDYVEIKSGRIINLSFEVDIYIDKDYNKADVVSSVIETIKNYMDINKHLMGDDVFVGDIEREISSTDGVLNLIDFRVYNETGDGYSKTRTTQEIMTTDECSPSERAEMAQNNRYRIDLVASDGILYSDGDTMLEIKYPEKDIKIKVKVR